MVYSHDRRGKRWRAHIVLRLNPTLPSSASLIDSFLKDLQGIAQLFSGRSQRDTFTVTICAGTGTVVTWTADVDCTLTGVYLVQGGGSSNSLARVNPGNVVPVVGVATRRQVIAWFQGGSAGNIFFPFIFCREKFSNGDKVYWRNDSAGTSIVLLVFES